jgi:hypothetical protein
VGETRVLGRVESQEKQALSACTLNNVAFRDFFDIEHAMTHR